MARRPKKFESVKHGTFEADIRLDPESGRFSCDYGGQEFNSTSLPDVRKWAWERLRAMSALEWTPIMEVNFNAEDSRVNNLVNCSNLEIYIERFHAAWDGKRWVKTPWVVMKSGHFMCSGPNTSDMDQENYPMPPEMLAQQRIARSQIFYAAEKIGNVMKFPLIEEGGRHPTYYVPFTEERWQTMVGIIEKLRELRARIHTMLSTTDGWNQLAAIAGVKLLTAPDDPAKS